MNPLFDLLRCPLHPNSGRLEPVSSDALRCPECIRYYPVVNGIPDLVVEAREHRDFLAREANQWDEQAPRYDEKRRRDLVYMACVEAAVHALKPEVENLVLDAACGTGMPLKAYLRPRVRTVAFDLSLESLLRLRAELSNPDVLYVRGDLLALPFASGTFCKVLCANAIQHLPDETARYRCVAELGRVGRPGARVVVTTHNFSIPKRRQGWPKEGSAGGSSGVVQYIYRSDAAEFRALLSSVLNVEYVGGAGLPLPYRFKLTPLSRRLERVLRGFPVSARWGHILVGIGYTPPR